MAAPARMRCTELAPHRTPIRPRRSACHIVFRRISEYLELVDDIQITEFDIRINEEAGGGLQFSRGEGQQYTEEIQQMQEQKYSDLFEIMRKYKDNISCVTFWNLSDRDSWLGANNYPLLYDSEYQRKPVYYTVRDFKKKK